MLDNNVPQSVEQVYVEQLPLNVIMVLDTSGSVAGERLAFLKKGALAIVDRLRPADRVALMSFSHLLDLPTAFTADRAWVRAAIESLRAGGSTAMLDAAFAGLALRGASSTRTLMVTWRGQRHTGERERAPAGDRRSLSQPNRPRDGRPAVARAARTATSRRPSRG